MVESPARLEDVDVVGSLPDSQDRQGRSGEAVVVAPLNYGVMLNVPDTYVMV